MKTTLEATYTLWIDASGESIEVGDDRDGLDMTEIRYRSEDGKVVADIRFNDEQIPVVIEALKRHLAFKKERLCGQ